MRKQLRKALGLFLSLFAVSGLSADRDTVIQERAFHLYLPGKWTGGYDSASQTWSYATPSNMESVTVGILERTAGPEMAKIKEDFDAYLAIRRKQELKVGGSSMSLAEPRLREVPGAMIASYEGYDSTTGRRTKTSVVVNERAAASYYYEALKMSEAVFKERAAAVLSKVGLVK